MRSARPTAAGSGRSSSFPIGCQTRLISRNRFDTTGYKTKQWIGYAVMEPGSWVMERKMLLTIKELAEDLAHATPAPRPSLSTVVADRAAKRVGRF